MESKIELSDGGGKGLIAPATSVNVYKNADLVDLSEKNYFVVSATSILSPLK